MKENCPFLKTCELLESDCLLKGQINAAKNFPKNPIEVLYPSAGMHGKRLWRIILSQEEVVAEAFSNLKIQGCPFYSELIKQAEQTFPGLNAKIINGIQKREDSLVGRDKNGSLV